MDNFLQKKRKVCHALFSLPFRVGLIVIYAAVLAKAAINTFEYVLNSASMYLLSWSDTTVNPSVYLAVLGGAGDGRLAAAAEPPGSGCARSPSDRCTNTSPVGATCSLLDVYYKSMQFHKAPACNKNLLHV